MCTVSIEGAASMASRARMRGAKRELQLGCERGRGRGDQKWGGKRLDSCEREEERGGEGGERGERGVEKVETIVDEKKVIVTHDGSLSEEAILEKLQKWSSASGKAIGPWQE